MQQAQFQEFLKSLSTLSPEQLACLHNTLPPYPAVPEASSHSRLLERLKYYFDQHPYCPHCSCESMTRWGQNAGHQRYRCNECGRTCNALSKTPLAHFRIREKLDAYLTCMDGGTTLRPAAAQCVSPIQLLSPLFRSGISTATTGNACSFITCECGS